MRHPLKRFILAAGFFAVFGAPTFAQHKSACQLVSKADAEAILKVTLLPPKPFAPFRSLLDPDFTSGTIDQGCTFTNFAYGQPKPPKVVNVGLEVRYSATPDLKAMDEARKQVDTRTYDHPTDLSGLGDAAFWIGPPNNVTLFVFVGGTTRLMIGPSEIGLEAEKALAAKALASLGKAPTTYSYGTQPTGLKKPVLAAGANPSPLDQLKRALTAKAETGNVKAQTALGKLYESGQLGNDGKVQPDYAGAAYWFHQASDRGDSSAAYELAILYNQGLGVPADPAQSFKLLQKAAEAGYVPAMPLLSDIYAGQKTPVSRERATDWATQAANAGEPRGWLTLGFEYREGLLGGDRPYWYKSAMLAFRKAADGGNCVAMAAIGDLYSKGEGVPADKNLAESWNAKALKCQDGNLASLQHQLAQYRARAAAAREPLLSAMPVIPNSAPVVARNGHGSAVSANDKILAGVVAAVAIAFAISALTSKSEGAADNSGDNVDPMAASNAAQANYMWHNNQCVQSGFNGGYNDMTSSCN